MGNTIRPEIGFIAPVIARRSEVFPEPLGPTMPRNAPGGTARSMFTRTGSLEYAHVTRSKRTSSFPRDSGTSIDLLPVRRGSFAAEISNVDRVERADVSTQCPHEALEVEGHETDIRVRCIAGGTGKVGVAQV